MTYLQSYVLVGEVWMSINVLSCAYPACLQITTL